MGLSIIIPTRNRSNCVSECVQALEHNDAEIIVVDDASDDPG
jgi:glycosyltransferase involved in cell wall biosynthesis